MLLVLYDDTGMTAWSPYGGRINMPTMQRLADNGPTYTQWHTTALCSPTRSCLLTGRNHHEKRTLANLGLDDPERQRPRLALAGRPSATRGQPEG